MGQGKNVVAQCTYPRSKTLPESVMCADARTRGCDCKQLQGYGVLPVLSEKLTDYYTHVREFADKLTADLKRVGCWGISPLKSLGLEVLSVPGSDLASVNKSRLKTAFHRWDPYNAPVPRYTRLLWWEVVDKYELTFTQDKSILWDVQSWLWDSPTWYISGVSTKKREALCCATDLLAIAILPGTSNNSCHLEYASWSVVFGCFDVSPAATTTLTPHQGLWFWCVDKTESDVQLWFLKQAGYMGDNQQHVRSGHGARLDEARGCHAMPCKPTFVRTCKSHAPDEFARQEVMCFNCM